MLNINLQLLAKNIKVLWDNLKRKEYFEIKE